MEKVIGVISKEATEKFCDRCGKILNFDEQNDHSATVEFHYGYYSKRDGDCCEFHYCQDCAPYVHTFIEKFNADMKKKKDYTKKKLQKIAFNKQRGL